MDELLEKIKQTPLLERIDIAIDMISAMCRDGRCPKMSIPARATVRRLLRAGSESLPGKVYVGYTD